MFSIRLMGPKPSDQLINLSIKQFYVLSLSDFSTLDFNDE